MTRSKITPVPRGTGIVLDADTRVLRNGQLLLGGRPRRVLRLSEAGTRAFTELQAGTVRSSAGAVLARRLLHAGFAHPRPQPPEPSMRIVTIIPVRDRAAELDRCLNALGGASSDRPVIVVDDGSHDPDAVAQTARRHHTQLVARTMTGGPAAARNTGLDHIEPATTDAVAFLDSDCLPNPDWAHRLTAHLTDPTVGAAAPRIIPAAHEDTGPSSAYLTERSALDLGSTACRVEPGGTVAYVPTAALLIRTTALPRHAFDEALRYGEDVDTIWRIIDAGWDIRYEPSIQVEHAGPASLTAHLARRYHYGTSAGPLARRHPTRMAPIITEPLPTAAAGLLLLRRPGTASAVAGIAATLLARRLWRTHAPAKHALPMTAQAITSTLFGISRVTTQFALPAALPALLIGKERVRRATTTAALIAMPHIVNWAQNRPTTTAPRWIATAIIDDIAYGAGVWYGALHARTARPLLPRRNKARRSVRSALRRTRAQWIERPRTSWAAVQRPVPATRC